MLNIVSNLSTGILCIHILIMQLWTLFIWVCDNLYDYFSAANDDDREDLPVNLSGANRVAMPSANPYLTRQVGGDFSMPSHKETDQKKD